MKGETVVEKGILFEENPDLIANVLRLHGSPPGIYLAHVFDGERQEEFILTGCPGNPLEALPKRRLSLPGSLNSVEVDERGFLVIRDCVPGRNETLREILGRRIAYAIHHEHIAQAEEERNPGLFSKDPAERMRAIARDEMSTIRRWHEEALEKSLSWHPDIVEYAKIYCSDKYDFIAEHAPELFDEHQSQSPSM